MAKDTSIKLFEKRTVRSEWDADAEKWWFSITDIIAVLTDQITHDGARTYWKVLKHRLKKEGNETATNCNQLKMRTPDSKMRLTDVAREQIEKSTDKLVILQTERIGRSSLRPLCIPLRTLRLKKRRFNRKDAKFPQRTQGVISCRLR